MNLRWIAPSLLAVSLLAAMNTGAAETLTAGETKELLLAPSAHGAFVISADRGDFLAGVVESPAGVSVTLIEPDANPPRRFEGPSRTAIDFQFVAAARGPHRLDIANDGKAEAHIRVKLETHILRAVADEPAPAAPRASKRIAALEQAIARDGESAVRTFWRDVEREGTPLVEADGDQYQVTFLWRGTPASNRVQLFWPARTELRDLEMTRIGATDIWFKTVRLPKGTRLSYRIAPGIPRVPGKTRDRHAILAVIQRDPLNPRTWPDRKEASPYEISSILELPDAPPQPWITLADGVPQPRIESHTIASRILGNERTLSVIVPEASSPSEPPALLIVFDEDAYLERTPTPTILANLIAAKKIPPTLAVLVGNPTRDSRASELPPNRNFADFLATELVPWIRERFPVTRDRQRVVVAGSSYGGLAAAFAAKTHPEVFGNVLSQSGSFWWAPQPPEKEEPNSVARAFAADARAPVRFYLSAGLFEVGLSGEQGGILEHNRHLRDVLIARGYDVHYREVAGGHDHLSWRGTLAEGLQVLLGESHATCDRNVVREVAINNSEQRTIVSDTDPSLAYRVSISIPDSEAPEQGFPVLYLLDGNASFGTMVDAVRQFGGPEGVQTAVIVGIAAVSEKRYDGDARLRDYTPIVTENGGGGANAFLDVLEKQVKPLVEQRVRIDRTRQSLFGHSLGGLFVLHALFTRPDSFTTYVAASPSIWWADRAILAEEQQFLARAEGWPRNVRLLVTVGEYEQKLAPTDKAPDAEKRLARLQSRRMVDASRELTQRLHAKAPDARIEHVEIPGETHGSVVSSAIVRAVRFSLGDRK